MIAPMAPPVFRVTDSRDELEDALRQGTGIRVLPAGAASPPSVFVIPGSPWIEPSALAQNRRMLHWVIVGVVGLGSEAAITDAEALVEDVAQACAALPSSWSVPTFEPPGLLSLAGASYLAFRATLRTLI